MHCTTLIQGNTGTLKIEGRFTFENHQEFRDHTAQLLATPGLTAIHLDLRNLGYLDSNALGMLLLLREKARPRNLEIRLLDPSPAVMEILDMVQFGKLFQIISGPQA